ncbi:MAG: DUF177 domain-containing protein [Gemmatimonadetes bacterium]|nr:DUF177 domain-containing protein [Gemmatimonadota bacterium]
MLSIPTQSLSAGAVRVEGVLDRDDKVWLEGDPRPAEGVRVSGRLSQAGQGRFYFSGSVSGVVQQECRRCLREVITEIDVESHVLFADAAHVDEDDPDVFPLVLGRSGAEVDLRPAVREEWMVEVPAFALCAAACKGLCTKCGGNLNTGACICARPN